MPQETPFFEWIIIISLYVCSGFICSKEFKNNIIFDNISFFLCIWGLHISTALKNNYYEHYGILALTPINFWIIVVTLLNYSMGSRIEKRNKIRGKTDIGWGEARDEGFGYIATPYPWLILFFALIIGMGAVPELEKSGYDLTWFMYF